MASKREQGEDEFLIALVYWGKQSASRFYCLIQW
jgi:hypothetical protein